MHSHICTRKHYFSFPLLSGPEYVVPNSGPLSEFVSDAFCSVYEILCLVMDLSTVLKHQSLRHHHSTVHLRGSFDLQFAQSSKWLIVANAGT